MEVAPAKAQSLLAYGFNLRNRINGGCPMASSALNTEQERAQFILDRWWTRWGVSRLDYPYKYFYVTSFYFGDRIIVSFKRRYKQ
jgi:hypothetical protein